jgi:hypothetical protein
MMSNNALIRLACLAGVPWLDWRLTCHANVGPTHPREPSVRGGAPTSPGRSMLACVCLSGCVIVRDARRWEATWACSRLIMGHASWLRYCSPMASMMTAASTVRTMMTPWRVGATHPHVSAGRRGDPGAEGDMHDERRSNPAWMRRSITDGTPPRSPPNLRPHAPSTKATACSIERHEPTALPVLACIPQLSFFML